MSQVHIVARNRTPLLDDALKQTIIDAYLTLFGDNLTSKRLSLLFAQLAFEHGAGADTRAPTNGRACWSCFDYDFGNRRGIEGDAGAFVMTAQEIINGSAKDMTGIWPAYSTPEEGMISWLVMMSTHYQTAWTASLTGNCSVYGAALKLGGYYTTSVMQYVRGLSTWQRIYQQRWPS